MESKYYLILEDSNVDRVIGSGWLTEKGVDMLSNEVEYYNAHIGDLADEVAPEFCYHASYKSPPPEAASRWPISVALVDIEGKEVNGIRTLRGWFRLKTEDVDFDTGFFDEPYSGKGNYSLGIGMLPATRVLYASHQWHKLHHRSPAKCWRA